MTGPSQPSRARIPVIIGLAGLLAACAPATPSAPATVEPSPTIATPTSATASPSTEPTTPTPEPSVASLPVYTWHQGTIDDTVGRTEISDVFVLPSAALAVERSVDDDTVRRLLRSEDGASWAAGPSPIKGFVFEGGAVVDGELTALGHVGDARRPVRQVWTTADGLAWVRIEQAEPMRFGRRGGFAALAKATAGWTAQAYEIIDAETSHEHVFFSTDRSTWRETTLPSATITTIASNGSSFAYVGVLISRTKEPTMTWTSSDGMTWTSHPSPELPKDDGPTAIAGTGTGFAVTGQHFVPETEASQPLGWWSSDGTSWEPASFAVLEGPAGEAAPREIVASTAGLIAHGNGDPLRNALWTSTDGRAWTQVTPLPDESSEGGAFTLWHDGRVLLFGRAGVQAPVVWLGSR